MQVAIVSDIHGNRHAFEAVLAEADAAGATEIWCLGDLVGYGADPNECVRLARERAAICLAGNHDLGVTGGIDLGDFSRGAAIAAMWTRDVLADDHRTFLQALAPAGQEEGFALVHASPRDPVWEYVLSALLAEACLDEASGPVTFVGHSHVALSFSRADRGAPVDGQPRRPGDVLDLSAGEWILNPGSVGQPRDGDWRAAWLLLETATRRAEWRRTRYDLDGAQAAIRAAGLPESLAERLGYGQ